MPLETGTYVDALDIANPPGTDSKSQGDDHLRLIKTVLKNTFPNATGPLKFASKDATATMGPELRLYRNSPSPAASDVIGALTFSGNDGTLPTPLETIYGRIVSTMNDVTAGSEDATLFLQTIVAGSLSNRVALNAAGVTLYGKVTATDGSGIDGLNASNITSGTLASLRFPATVTHMGEIRLASPSLLYFTASDPVTYIGAVAAGSGAWRSVNQSAEVFRVDTAGIHVGRTTDVDDVQGCTVNDTGRITAVSTSAEPFRVCRNGTDGILLYFIKNGIGVGTMVTTAGAVTLNAFMGSHWSQLIDDTEPAIYKGTVVDSLDAFCAWAGEGTDDRLPRFKINDTADSTSVYGVFLSWDDEDELHDAYIVSTGLAWVRVASGQSVARGDLLSSAGNGCAKKQTGSTVTNATIAKVASNTHVETYPDGSFTVSAAMLCG